MSRITDEDLDAIEARANATPDGPWSASYAPDTRWIRTERWTYVASIYDAGDEGADIAAFIAHAREDVPDLIAEVRRLKQEVTYADRAMRERHTRFATLHADVSLLARDLGMLGDAEYAPDDHDALCDFMRRAQNEIENLCIAATIGPRVAEVSAAVEREASIARFRELIDGFLAAPAMYARDPECGAHVLYGAMLASGGNGRTWYDACLAVGLARGNVAVAAETWEEVATLARHLHETAPKWVGTR